MFNDSGKLFGIVGTLAGDRHGATALALAVALLGASGCGRLTRSSGGDGAESGGLPDFLVSPPLLSPVPNGSRDVRSVPPPGPVRSLVVLVRLEAEPGAKILYSFGEPVSGALDDSAETYEQPLQVFVPATLYAQAETEDGRRGDVRAFKFEEDPAFIPMISRASSERLPVGESGGAPQELVPLAPFGEPKVFQPDPALAAGTGGMTESALDGLDSDWDLTARGVGFDGGGDVPAGNGAIDLLWAAGNVTGDQLRVAFGTAAAPRQAREVIYGFEVGPSNVSTASFGDGARYVYKAEIQDGALTLEYDNSGKKQTVSASGAVVGGIVEFALAWTDLPEIAKVRELVLRVYAVSLGRTGVVVDRSEPIYLRSNMLLARGATAAVDGRSWVLDLMHLPTLDTARSASAYLTPGLTLIPGLERINGIRMYQEGNIPFFWVEKEVNGYAGLNTSDRGLMTTVGPGAGPLARFQIMAHELAHYQNARFSRLTSRWIQEGMSEWSAERLLYRHYPARAVHRFVRKLRFDRYFDVATKTEDTLALEDWGTAPSDIGYEKSLMFIDALETRVGQQALIDAFRLAVNRKMGGRELHAELERSTGLDLEDVFSWWVFAGNPLPDLTPEALYTDADGDGLLQLDELKLGTDPSLMDSDGDGYGDGEEYFSGRDAAATAEGAGGAGAQPALAEAESGDLSAMMRLTAAPGEELTFSLDPADPAPAIPYRGPLLFRPPYELTARAGADGPPRRLTRDLYVNGAKVVPDLPVRRVLPDVARTTANLGTPAATGPSAGRLASGSLPLADHAADLPEFLSAYNLTRVSADLSTDGLKVVLQTAGTPDPTGQYGDYMLHFDSVAWSAGTGPVANRRAALVLSGGSPYIYRTDPVSNVETGTQANSGVTVDYLDRSIEIVIDTGLLDTWLGAAGDLMIQVKTQVTLDEGHKVRDFGAALTLHAEGFITSAGTIAGAFGDGSHTLEVMIETSGHSEARATHLRDLGLSALQAFETVLGRPWLDRSHWLAHVFYRGTGSATMASAHSRAGAWLAVDAGLPAHYIDYLYVEQLARLALTDLLDRSGSAPFWIQEVFVQWLTASAMHLLTPTAQVQGFHLDRIDDWTCYVDDVVPQCRGFFTSDLPLAQWDLSTITGTGSVRALMMTLKLDAMLGADRMARIMGTLVNRLPDSQSFREIVTSYADSTQAGGLESLWTQWVDGSGSSTQDRTAIRNEVRDQDGDGLLKFQESRFGSSDLVPNGYFP